MSTTEYRRTMTLPVTTDRVLILQKQPDCSRTVHMRHLARTGDTNPATAKFQESADGSTWADISGTTQVINAGYGAVWELSSTSPYVALAAYGNVDIEILVSRSDPDGTLPERVSI